ncbi:VapE domain-containing protein [Parabacteroides sp. ZJ-118]|uniref:VapE domain-containing protein n=1 Tax=Parabacteroides sp. ZJ-118 TaxID=2709398 RepID=UPI001F14AEAD|nr:VapE domain-containing protein [Parabacteroides sp. ZJ-118]
MINNPFLSTVKRMFGRRSRTYASASCSTPKTEGEELFAPALVKIQRICAFIPGSRFCIDVEEGRMVIAVAWTPRTNESKHFGKHRFVIDATGGHETNAGGHEADAGVTALAGKRAVTGGKPVRREEATESPSKITGLVRRVTDYLTSRYLFRFNVLTEQTEYMERATCTEQAEESASHLTCIYRKVDKRALNALSLDALEAGVECWDRDVQRFVHSKRITAYHPFTDYMEHLPGWDGKDRVTELAARVSDNPVWLQGFHRWMLGVAAQWMEHGTGLRANSVAPLIVSNEQGWGKSTFCRSLMPNELADYYTDSFDLNAPSACEQKLAAFGLINMDEFDRLPASKMPLLKNLMQMSALNIRKAYRQSHEPLRRIASFIGTSNLETLLADRTGSRRFLCVKLEHPIDCAAPIDHAQIYAQLKEELLQGERHWFSKEEEAAIRRNNSLFYKHVPEEELFGSVFRFATADDKEEDVRTLNAAQIFEAMKQAHPAAMRGLTAYSLSRVLPQLGERIHTMKGNVYRVVEV